MITRILYPIYVAANLLRNFFESLVLNMKVRWMVVINCLLLTYLLGASQGQKKCRNSSRDFSLVVTCNDTFECFAGSQKLECRKCLLFLFKLSIELCIQHMQRVIRMPKQLPMWHRLHILQTSLRSSIRL